MFIEVLKRFDADATSLDELVALYHFATGLHIQYEELSIEEPDWLTLKVKAIRREIQSRVADQIEKRKREITNRLDSLKTPAEKRKELQAELAALEKASV